MQYLFYPVLLQKTIPINSTTTAFIKRRGLANCRTFATK